MNKRQMRVKQLVIAALFLGIGTLLNAIMPPLFLAMKPDLLLATLFLVIYFFADRSNILVFGLTAGVLSGLTSDMAGGFIPNVVDKLVTSIVIFALVYFVKKVADTYGKELASALIVTIIGTIISGTIFLSAYLFVSSLPFMSLIYTVVLPAAAANAVVMAIIFPIVTKIVKRSGRTVVGKSA